jgi:hypothetical protein
MHSEKDRERHRRGKESAFFIPSSKQRSRGGKTAGRSHRPAVGESTAMEHHGGARR